MGVLNALVVFAVFAAVIGFVSGILAAFVRDVREAELHEPWQPTLASMEKEREFEMFNPCPLPSGGRLFETQEEWEAAIEQEKHRLSMLQQRRNELLRKHRLDYLLQPEYERVAKAIDASFQHQYKIIDRGYKIKIKRTPGFEYIKHDLSKVHLVN